MSQMIKAADGCKLIGHSGHGGRGCQRCTVVAIDRCYFLEVTLNGTEKCIYIVRAG